MGRSLRIALERGKSPRRAEPWVFASAVDWPGWARRGRGDDGAVATLLDHAERYAAVAARAPGVGFEPGEPQVIGAVESGGAVDFGALGTTAPWDDDPLTGAELDLRLALLQACWDAFDAIAAASAEQLRKGPRGGGRDRDPIIDHTREAERSYARSIGVKVPPRTPWPDQRAAILAGLQSGEPSGGSWTPRYLIRRVAWHMLDHAWEIEDKQPDVP